MAKNNSSNLLKFRGRTGSLVNSNNPSNVKNVSSNENVKKQFIRETGFNQLINEIIISTCQKYMECNIKKRLIYYFFLVVIGSILCDAAPLLIKSFFFYKTEKNNFFNQYFVKLGWFWTLFLLIPFQILTRKTIDNSKKWFEIKDASRIIITTLFWYFSISLFLNIENSTGKCSLTGFKTKRNCLQSGNKWTGFDISGHTFILIFSSLILREESKIIDGFENFGYLLSSRYQAMEKIYKKNFYHYELYIKFLLPIRVLYISITFLSLLWDFMLIQTILHYHNFLQKMIAFGWAIGCWYLCYYFLFTFEIVKFISMPHKAPKELPNDQKEINLD